MRRPLSPLNASKGFEASARTAGILEDRGPKSVVMAMRAKPGPPSWAAPVSARVGADWQRECQCAMGAPRPQMNRDFSAIDGSMARPFSILQSLFCAFCLVLPSVFVIAPKGTVPVMLAMALATFLSRWAGGKPIRIEAKPLALSLAPLLLWATLASLWSFDVGQALVLALRLAVLLAAGFWLISCALSLSDQDRRRIVHWLIAGFAVAMAWIIVEAHFGHPLGRTLEWLGLGRQVTEARFNRGSTYLAILVWPLTTALWQGRSGAWALLLPGALLLLFLPLASLSALLSLAAALLFLAFAAILPRASRWCLTAGVVVSLLAIPPMTAAIDRSSLEVFDPRAYSSIHRLHIWSFTGDRILERPVAGWGFNASRDMPKGTAEGFKLDDKQVIPLHPHNAALQLWLELGLVGAGLALVPLLLLLSKIARLGPIDRAFGQAMFVGGYSISSVSYGLWQNQWVAALLACGIVFLLCRKGEVPRLQ